MTNQEAIEKLRAAYEAIGKRYIGGRFLSGTNTDIRWEDDFDNKEWVGEISEPAAADFFSACFNHLGALLEELERLQNE
jgi:hypothetical protein